MPRPVPATERPPEDGPSGEAPATPSVAPETVLDLLEDEYARAILVSAATTAKPARELVAELGTSRATVYRRLNSLEEAGLVESTVTLAADGHHRQRYRATLDAVTLSLDDDGLRIERLAVDD